MNTEQQTTTEMGEHKEAWEDEATPMTVEEAEARIRKLLKQQRYVVDQLCANGDYGMAGNVIDMYKETIKETADDLNLELIGTVPMDNMIAERDLKGLPLFDLPDDSDAVQEVAKIAEKLGL